LGIENRKWGFWGLKTENCKLYLFPSRQQLPKNILKNKK
jgi:hypothetical protein